MIRFFILCFGLLALAPQAQSHPHVWIQARAQALVNEQGEVIGIRNRWTIDEAYSQMASDGLDTNGDGEFSQAELEPLSRENLEAMADYEFFTYAYLNGEKITGSTAGNAHQFMKNGELTLTFDVNFTKPINPNAGAFTFSVYDPSYFIEINMLEVAAGNGCTATASPPTQNSQALATQKMLADKPADWQPDIAQDFGALFADVVSVNCAKSSPPTISKDKLLTGRRTAEDLPRFMDNPSGFILGLQNQFYSDLSSAIRAINQANGFNASLWLMIIAFAYGIFHAAGPGHGKAVISGWLLASHEQLRKGIIIAGLSSLIQALSAILIVSLVLLFVQIAGGIARDAAKATAFWVEAASYGLIMGLGLALAFRASKSLWHKPQQHHHIHDENCGCDHAHMPDAKQVSEKISFKQSLSMALAIGMRPCTGALLVLLFASAGGIYAAGIAASFAMALGTFITIATIASLTVISRDLALRIFKGKSPWLMLIGKLIQFTIGLLIALLALSLLMGLFSGKAQFL